VEETALFVEVDNLHGLEDLGELTGGDVGVDVEHLAVGGLGERGEDREASGADGSLDGGLVNAVDLSDELVLFLVEVVGVEDARGDGARAGAETLERRGETEVLLEEDALMSVGYDGGYSRERSGGSWRLRSATNCCTTYR